MRVLFFIMITLLLNACSSTSQSNSSDLYLRSEFTWWEANPEFKFKKIKDSTDMSVAAKIEADGNPYHIKIADKQWSADTNCGYKELKDKVIKLNTWITLNCHYDFEKLSSTPIQKPFKLTPNKTSIYTFIVKMTEQGPSHLMVKRVAAGKYSN